MLIRIEAGSIIDNIIVIIILHNKSDVHVFVHKQSHINLRLHYITEHIITSMRIVTNIITYLLNV